MKRCLSPGKPTGLHQFHKHKSIDRHNDRIGSIHPMPHRLIEFKVRKIECQILQALQIKHYHQEHYQPRQFVITLAPEHPHHHGVEHDTHTIYKKVRHSIFMYLSYISISQFPHQPHNRPSHEQHSSAWYTAGRDD